MKIHILGIGGTFMAGIALLAKQCGHEVTGSDNKLYPPMSDQLEAAGIEYNEGYEHALPKQLDYVIVGNVIRRGNPQIKAVLAQNITYISGPAWLAAEVLQQRAVLAVSGTHGKTTTASMLAWVLTAAKKDPGFLIGGIPENFGVSAKLGSAPFFVVEADEYDSAFFDKRSKFIHYRPRTLILNNLEFDHADIFPDLTAIKQQFHGLIRTVPNNGLIIRHAQDENITDMLKMGCWTPTVSFSATTGEWQAQCLQDDGSEFLVKHNNVIVGKVEWSLLGKHNVENALAVCAAAAHIGVSPAFAIPALSSFKNVKRRLEVKGVAKEIVVYDDFAHHPTAIATTLAGLRAKIGRQKRLIAVLEFGSYTMRSGAHKHQIQAALEDADMVICKKTDTDWGLKTLLQQFKQPTAIYDNVTALVQGLVAVLRPGDHVLVMSNTGFDGMHQQLLSALANHV